MKNMEITVSKSSVAPRICAVIIFVLTIILFDNLKLCERLQYIKKYPSSVNSSESISIINMDDVVVCLRTSSQRGSRLTILLRTWIPLAQRSVYIITDYNDRRNISKIVESQWIISDCKSSHRRKDLCCKMGVELNLFLDSGKKWFCHVDDDSYLNIPILVKLLSHFDSKENFYIGKESLPMLQSKDTMFQFATGGAGFCLSQSLVLRMSSYVLNSKFEKLCEKLFLPDDCTIGYITNHLGVNLTSISSFHSHLEDLFFIKAELFPNEISLSYSYQNGKVNIISVGGFSLIDDPSRFYSLHCHLYPTSKECLHLKSSMASEFI